MVAILILATTVARTIHVSYKGSTTQLGCNGSNIHPGHDETLIPANNSTKPSATTVAQKGNGQDHTTKSQW